MRVTFLGTGTSHGVPMINCNCDVCLSDNPKNKRFRCSAVVQTGGKTILIDTTPDMRTQFLRNPFERLDAVLFTHDHADHMFGMDDLRRFSASQDERIPVYGNNAMIARLQNVFGYAFGDGKEGRIRKGIPNVEGYVVNSPFFIDNLKVIPIPLIHGKMNVLGYRIGNFAYCTDVSEIPASSYPLLEGLEVLVLDALRERPHFTHFSIEQAMTEAKKIKAKNTYFTHMNHNVDHDKHSHLLEASMQFAYDGLLLEI
jgi:phosphoribosyl 1,2-cyclic phosphate phosphodiesterase